MDFRDLHGFVNVSPFMLFEATGDSEEDSDLNMSSYDDDNMEVDDAQSCCSDSSEIYDDDQDDNVKQDLCMKKTDQECVHVHDYDLKYKHQNDFDEDNDDDDDGVIDQECSSSRKVGFVFSRIPKCKVFADSKIESLKKEEKDKLFWDTCLAS